MQPMTGVPPCQASATFFCRGCLDDRPAADASPDPRYCRGCCDFLIKEAESLTSGRRPAWFPQMTKDKSPDDGHGPTADPAPEPVRTCTQPAAGREKTVGVLSMMGVGILSTLGSSRRGRRKILLPTDTISHLQHAGLGAKAIATRLRAEHGIEVSYKTIQRRQNV